MTVDPTSNDTAQLDQFGSSEDDVLATVFSFEQCQIRKFLHQDVTILEVTGHYSPTLGKKLERLAARVKNNLGLDLSGLSGLQSGILSSIQRIHKRLKARKQTFLLCNPPEKLVDLLRLNDLLGSVRIASGLGEVGEASKSIVSKLGEKESGDLLEDTKELESIPVSTEIARFNRSLKRTEKLEKGLDSASKCIRKILPSSAPDVPDYDFSFSYTPCDKVGGDFFDFIPLGRNVLGVSIGDVSGHGLDSAIVMAMAKKIIRVRARDLAKRPTHEVLCKANEDLYEELGSRIFITALYARIHLVEGIVHFARAGHEPLVHFRPGSKVTPVFYETKGIAIGMDPGRRFNELVEEKRVRVRHGEGLLLYTDGIVESWNARRDLFSRPRLAYTLEQLQPSCTAETAIASINQAVERFAHGVPSEDDMTAIVIMRD